MIILSNENDITKKIYNCKGQLFCPDKSFPDSKSLFDSSLCNWAKAGIVERPADAPGCSYIIIM